MDPAPTTTASVTTTVNIPALNAFVILEQQARCAMDVLNSGVGNDAVKAAANATIAAYLTAKAPTA